MEKKREDSTILQICHNAISNLIKLQNVGKTLQTIKAKPICEMKFGNLKKITSEHEKDEKSYEFFVH
jgi:hypothetical protein